MSTKTGIIAQNWLRAAIKQPDASGDNGIVRTTKVIEAITKHVLSELDARQAVSKEPAWGYLGRWRKANQSRGEFDSAPNCWWFGADGYMLHSRAAPFKSKGELAQAAEKYWGYPIMWRPGHAGLVAVRVKRFEKI
jgi:hypothetical protein